MRPHRKPHEGIDTRHSRSCASRPGGACNCCPTFQANVWHARERRRVRKTFATVSEAKAWRRDALTALSRGTMKAPTKQTLAEAASAWLVGVREGRIRNRSGDPYKPSAVRGYEAALRRTVLPQLGY